MLLALGGSYGNYGVENTLTMKVNEATWDQASQNTAGVGLAHALPATKSDCRGHRKSHMSLEYELFG